MAPGPSASNAAVARRVLTETLRVRPGENVTIESWSGALPWAVPFVNEARRLGAHPMMLYEDEPSFWDALRSGRSRATGIVGGHEWDALKATDAYVFFFGPSEWPRYDGLPDRRTKGVAAYNGEWYRRAAKARLRGARMYIGRTSELAARRWRVGLAAWRAALQRASLASPQRMHTLGNRLARRLRGGRSVKVTHPDGTRVAFKLKRYPVQLDDGLVDASDLRTGNNMASIPGGVVGVAIDHTSAEGPIVGNHTVYPNTGPANGVRWTFREGRLVAHSYDEGGGAFDRSLAKAPKAGRDRLSYVSIGLNPALAGCPQMEDQELGAVMFRVGGNRFAGGGNANPFGSWMVLTGADVSIDGKPVLRGGSLA